MTESDSRHLLDPGNFQERLWNYRIGDMTREGVPESQLKELISAGQLGGEARVWSPGMAGWERISGIKPLLPGYSRKPRPLVRFLARFYDLIIYSCVVALFILVPSMFLPPVRAMMLYIFTDMSLTATIIWSVAMSCTWAIWEPLLISAFGTTPAKFLFNTWVGRARGDKLSLAESYRRSFNVLIKGWALGIPLLNFVAAMLSYFDFRIYGESSWDYDGHSTVIHGKIGPVRGLIVICFVIAYLVGPLLFLA